MKKILTTLIIATSILGGSSTHIYASQSTENSKTSLFSNKNIDGSSPHERVIENTLHDKIKLSNLDILKMERENLTIRLSSTEFPTLSLSEQLDIIKTSFKTQNSIMNEYKNTLLSTQTSINKDHWIEVLQNEENTWLKNASFLEQVISLTPQPTTKEKIIEHEEVLTQIISLMKDNRLKGRELEQIFVSKQRNSQVSQIGLLQKKVADSIRIKNEEEALDSLKTIVKLSAGDADYIQYLKLLLNKDSSYLIMDNDLFETESPFVISDDRKTWYISVDDLKEIMDINVVKNKKEAEMETNIDFIEVSHLNSTLIYNKDGMFLNGHSIGNPEVWKEDKTGRLYVNSKFLFELFGYTIVMSEQKNVITISKPVFPINEWDAVSVDELVKSINYEYIK